MNREAGRDVAAPAQREAAPPMDPPSLPDPAFSRHGPIAQLLIAWAPLSVILLTYAAARWVSAPLGARGYDAGTNRLGFGLHVAGPARVDVGVFGAVPTVWLQERLVDGSAHWYDAAAALVYVTHFVSIPVVTGVAWFCLRDRFAAWIAAVLTFTTLGVVGYVVYPAAPPWLAFERGEIGTVDRISGLGWDYLQLDWVGSLTALGQEGSNPVAAMPSLHAGSALLVALFFWPLANTLGRSALLAYVVLMAVTLVYTGEHYVVDVVAGWLAAGLAVAVGAAIRRPGRSRGQADSYPRTPRTSADFG
jgi:membrane-associated phospholipid phosphatase